MRKYKCGTCGQEWLEQPGGNYKKEPDGEGCFSGDSINDDGMLPGSIELLLRVNLIEQVTE